MKLQELFEKIDLTKTTPVKIRGKDVIPVSGDLVGHGVQGKVYSTGTGVVTKSAVITGPGDPTVKFLKTVIKHQDNPFFPKIYHAKIYKNKNSTSEDDYLYLVVQMEKLLPLTNPKIKETAIELLSRLGFNGEDAFDQLDALLYGPPKALQDFLKKSRNPKFKEAMSIILPGLRQFDSDLHSGNLMVRLTSAGPHLVITDPFIPGAYIVDL